MKLRVFDVSSKTMYNACSVDFETSTVYYKKNGIKIGIPLDDEHVTSYIGREDANGIPVFEGDIVEARYVNDMGTPDETLTIEIEVYGLSSSLDWVDSGGPDGSSWFEDVKVIGNIFKEKYI